MVDPVASTTGSSGITNSWMGWNGKFLRDDLGLPSGVPHGVITFTYLLLSQSLCRRSRNGDVSDIEGIVGHEACVHNTQGLSESIPPSYPMGARMCGRDSLNPSTVGDPMP